MIQLLAHCKSTRDIRLKIISIPCLGHYFVLLIVPILLKYGQSVVQDSRAGWRFNTVQRVALPVSYSKFYVHQNACPIASLAERSRTTNIRFIVRGKMVKICTCFHMSICLLSFSIFQRTQTFVLNPLTCHHYYEFS